MGFRLVPKSVTLNEFERRNGHYLYYFAEFGSFRGQLIKSGWLASQQQIFSREMS